MNWKLEFMSMSRMSMTSANSHGVSHRNVILRNSKISKADAKASHKK